MSMAYGVLLRQCEEEGVEPPSPAEFVQCRSADFPSRTVQSDAESCDINRIVAQYDRTGLVTHLAKGVPSFIDVSELTDFRETLDQVKRVGDFFSGLPASVRAEFANDPAVMLDAANDPSRHARLVELGLKGKEKPAEETPPA